MHRAPNRLVPPERERDITQSARNLDMRQLLTNETRRFDEVDGIVVTLFDTCRNGENIGVENDIFWREPNLIDQNVISSGANFNFARLRISLALFIKRHNDYRRSISAHQTGLLNETRLAFLHADRVDDRLALDAFQACFDNRPFRRVDHHGDTADIGFSGN